MSLLELLDKIDPPELPRAPWSLKVWRFEKTGEVIKLTYPGRKGKPRITVKVPFNRLRRVDKTRYTGEKLREIRKTHR